MRLRIHSDLHLEHLPDFGKRLIASLPVDGDEILVLAGDIIPLARRYETRTMEAINSFLEKGYKEVLFVPGNHEYYWTSISEGKAILAHLKHWLGLQVLRTGEIINVDGQRFLGDTMWYPYHNVNKKFERYFSDFKLISDSDKIYRENAAWKKFYRENAKPGDVVVTHHLPLYRSVATEFIGDQYNRFFLSAMPDEIKNFKPKLWVHGHTHYQFDYQEHDTRIVANGRGYSNEPTQVNWEIDKVVEI